MQRERLGPSDIPCHVIDDETDAAEISLAENVQREAMHPADEFDALRALIEGGRCLQAMQPCLPKEVADFVVAATGAFGTTASVA
jgi:hypothetical protein